MRRPSFLKRAFYAAVALLASGIIAHAAITGTWSEKQDEQISVGQLQLGQGTSTGTNTPTINNGSGIITTASLTTAQNAVTAITLTNNRIAVGDSVQCTVDPNGSAGIPFCANVAVSAGQAIFNVGNISATPLNTAVKIYFVVLKSGNPN
jgi:hypothetical protein